MLEGLELTQAHYVFIGLTALLLLGIVIWHTRTRSARMLGIDIGNAQIKIVEVQRGVNPVLLRFAVVPTPPGAIKNGQVLDAALLQQTLRQILKEHRFSVRRVATALTGQNLLIRTVELPAMPHKEIGDVVKWQFSQYFQMSSEETVSDYQVISGGAGEPLSVMLVAMQKEPVLSMTRVLAAAGLKTQVVDIEPLAVLRAVKFGQLAATMQGTVAVFDFGAGTTNISIFKDGVLRVARVLHFGGRDFTRTLMERLEISFEEAEQTKRTHGLLADSPIAELITPLRDELFLELSRTISFYVTDNREEILHRVFLLGGGSLLRELRPQLQAYLKEYSTSLSDDFEIVMSNPLEHMTLKLPAGAMSVGPGVAEAKPEPTIVSDPVPEIDFFDPDTEFVPRRLRHKVESNRRPKEQKKPTVTVASTQPKPEVDTLSLGLILGVALGMAVGEVKQQ